MRFALGFQILGHIYSFFVCSMPLSFNSFSHSRLSLDADAATLAWALAELWLFAWALAVAHQSRQTNGKPLHGWFLNMENIKHEWYGTMGFRLMREVKFTILIYWWEFVFVSIFVFVIASDCECFNFVFLFICFLFGKAWMSSCLSLIKVGCLIKVVIFI